MVNIVIGSVCGTEQCMFKSDNKVLWFSFRSLDKEVHQFDQTCWRWYSWSK